MVVFLFLTGLVLPGMADPASDTVDFRLDAHRWEHRLVLVFAPPTADSAFETQTARFEGHDAGFRERDLLLLTLRGEEAGSLWETPDGDATPLTDASVQRLYDHFGIPRDSFRVVLVGKDGTEKRRDAEPVTARSVFDTIDAMPMRQRELRESSGNGD